MPADDLGYQAGTEKSPANTKKPSIRQVSTQSLSGGAPLAAAKPVKKAATADTAAGDIRVRPNLSCQRELFPFPLWFPYCLLLL